MFRARNLVMETYLSMHDLPAGRRDLPGLSIPLSHLAARIERRLGRGR